MGSTFLPRAHSNLCRRNSQSHFSGSCHHVWDHDLVAARMVASRVGSHLYCRFHVYGDFSCPAICCLGLCRSSQGQSSSRWHVSGFSTNAASRRKNSANCRRADFCSCHCSDHRSTRHTFSISRYPPDRPSRLPGRVESRRTRCRLHLYSSGSIRSLCRARPRKEICCFRTCQCSILGRLTIPSVHLELGWTHSHIPRRLRNAHGPQPKSRLVGICLIEPI